MIHVLDVLTVRPTHVADVDTRVRDGYAPLIAGYGMRLAHGWMAPAVELHDEPVELLFLWELDDVPAFWRMRTASARDKQVLAFWDDLTPRLTSRSRRLMCDPRDTSVLR